jgi:hypothetical protein
MLSVTQPGEQPNSYLRRSVTLVRPPAKLQSDAEAKDQPSEDKPEE